MRSFSPAPLRRFALGLWTGWIRPLALPLLLVAAAKSALADINYVPTGSMQPTILPGDVVFINKLAYDLRVPFTTARVARWSSPDRGDIIVCHAPDDGTRLVKRVVGLPGDTVELRNEVLFINGRPSAYQPLAREEFGALPVAEREHGVFARETTGGRSHTVMVFPQVVARRTFGPITVPVDSYFVLGDNRDNSRDSRFFGPVAAAEVMGRAIGVFVSGDLARHGQPRFARFGTALE